MEVQLFVYISDGSHGMVVFIVSCKASLTHALFQVFHLIFFSFQMVQELCLSATHHDMWSHTVNHSVHGHLFCLWPWFNHLIIEVASFVFIFFNSEHPAGMTPKKTSRTACHRKGFIMYKGTECKADFLGHFLLVTAAVCRKVRQTNRVPQRNANRVQWQLSNGLEQ